MELKNLENEIKDIKIRNKKVELEKTWETAIGLQDVDGLKPSKYLIKTAKEHIEGNINIEEVKIRIDEYYEVQGSKKKL